MSDRETQQPENGNSEIEPPKTAVALRYDPERGDDAPLIVASGKDHMAEAILSAARRHKVPIREDKALAGVLAGLDLGSYIPPEMYRAVAEVLAWVYRVENAVAKR